MGKARKKPTPAGKDKQPDLDQFSSDGGDDADDMETFYQERDENLRTALAKTTLKKSSKNKKSVSWALDGNASDEENGRDEVLAFDDDSMDSDDNDDYQQIEGDDDDEDLLEEEDLTGAYGSGRKAYYNEDANADEEDAKLEEQEAVQIQKRYYEMLEKNDFGLELFREKPSTNNTDRHLDEESLRRHIILPDNLLELTGNERLQLIRDQSPELEPLCSELKSIFDDLKIYLLPLIQLVLDTSSLDEFQNYPGWQFVLAVLELYLTYCSYLSLYLMMKSTDLNLGKHPIVNDIEQYRSLCQLVHNDFQSIKSDLLKLCELLQERKSKVNQASIASRARLIMNNGISLQKTPTNGTSGKPSLRERMAKRVEKQQEEKVPTTEPDAPQGKRAITYQISKNKGLTVQRKKENRNPRVRHRNKYARALVKRKSRVPTARTEEERYTGEPTGIRSGQKRSIKLKS